LHLAVDPLGAPVSETTGPEVLVGEVVVGFDLDRAPAEVASVMMDKATQGDSQYIFTADDLDRVNREMLDRCQIVSYLQSK
jgi:hypothetical protein